MSDKKGKKSQKSRTFSALDGAALLLFDGAMTSEQKSKTAKKLRDKHDSPDSYRFYDKYTTSQEKKAWKKLKEGSSSTQGQGQGQGHPGGSSSHTGSGLGRAPPGQAAREPSVASRSSRSGKKK
ncbi:hypothetical protein JDV02_008123 [Purpureocillium takamizusanense]|uniref:Uncharacterized protein n=1 Tax=Purpureocillium takamizusanense TaxID=2060973 RepID=A0A9Q8QP29_9HYPO|nr:uncharacterized protein JDV02_008123 [Purpureocillium takamizusanense]UNI22214.1 hypothetical protein JDV02_008123 [Purpureocillium takamizusanense]